MASDMLNLSINKEMLTPVSWQEGNILVEEEENDMKATDLMLGDLVIHGFGEAGTITEICQNSVVIKANSFDVGDGMNEVSFAINELKPIPLTAEILAKNFNSTEIPDDPYGAYFYESDEYIEVYIKEYTDGLWEVVVDEIEFSSLPTWKMYVSNVHQLQHALRLCNISKKIEL